MRPILVVAFVLAACSKKSVPDTVFTSACVLTDESGAVFQCFEQTSDRPRNIRKEHCDGFEAAKKELREGPCPSTALGACEKEGDKSPCYRNRAECEERCKEIGGTFSQ